MTRVAYDHAHGSEHAVVVLRSLRYSGVAAVAVLWTTLLAGTRIAHFHLVGTEPISYLGSASSSAALFTGGLAAAAVLLTAFHGYVRHRYPVSVGFSLAMLGGLAAQMVAALVPIGGEPAVHRIHTTSALVLGVSLPLLMWRFAAGQVPGSWRRQCYGLLWAEVAACVAGFYLSGRSVAAVAEILPAAAFHAWILVVTFAAVVLDPGEVASEARCQIGFTARPAAGSLWRPALRFLPPRRHEA